MLMAKVLIVEDSKIMRSLIVAAVEKLGHEIVGEAADGLEGYDKYFELKPDLVMLDLTMPVMDGIQVLRKIKESDASAKIILLTANLQGVRLNDAISAGADGYLFKPLNETELKKLLGQIL
jgi:two-component system chemotaxis response regulator CheY